MDFQDRKRINPFDRPWLALFAHGFATSAFIGGCYLSVSTHAWWPVAVALVGTTALEVFWWYCLIRR